MLKPGEDPSYEITVFFGTLAQKTIIGRSPRSLGIALRNWLKGELRRVSPSPVVVRAAAAASEREADQKEARALSERTKSPFERLSDESVARFIELNEPLDAEKLKRLEKERLLKEIGGGDPPKDP